MSSKAKQILLWLMIISSALLFVYFIQRTQGKSPSELTVDKAITQIKNKEIQEVYLKPSQIELVDKSNNRFYTNIGSDVTREAIYKAVDEVNNSGTSSSIKITEEPASSGYFWLLLINALPFLLLVGILVFTLRQMQAGGNKALSFGKSRAKLLNNQQKRITFKDVAGVEEAKEELQEIIEFLKDPQKFQKLGGRIPKGVLMVGPPGTGKTWAVQRAVSLPTVQVSLEGSTEPETVVANIAQNKEGKFQAFLAETGKALKLAMLLAIVHCLRTQNLKEIFETSKKGMEATGLSGLPANLLALLPQKKFESFSDDFMFLVENLHQALQQGDESTIKQWLSLFDAYADPFELERWQEVLNLYQSLGANKVGTTVILSVEEIYHAVENRKILDLLINLMAGQKKLPLTKAGVVGGDLFGYNVSVWATGNPLRDAFLPEALSSRFGFQQFVGYPTAEEEKRRMELATKAISDPEAMKLNLLSTELADYWDLKPLQKPELAEVSSSLRNKIYQIVQWTRTQFNNGNLRSCACPRTASFWEVLVSAFTAQQISEVEAMKMALEATTISLVDLNENACPDAGQLANIRQYAESVMTSN
ncbi:MAG TPA: hypothetical protein PKY82_23975 [Pyrinomonadaceae bacterium]|nr:hypothetical protein [Pyrinomonadaceae bacterium]